MRFQKLALLLAIGSFLGLIIGFEAGASNYLTNSLVLIFFGSLFWFIGIRIFKKLMKAWVKFSRLINHQATKNGVLNL